MGVEYIFRAYDIRGIFGRDLTPEVAAGIGAALGTIDPGDFLVGGDIRSSTLALKMALAAGIASTGCDVNDVGIVPIGAALYACWSRKKTTVYVTASHLPPEWNGFKVCGRNALYYSSRDIERIRDAYLSGEFKRADWSSVGRIGQEPILEEYAEHLKRYMHASGLKIAIDCGNGAAALVAPRLFREAGHEVVELNCEIDPAFPARGSEPEPEKLGDLCRAVIEEEADLGMAFDGDGDRVVFVDDRGRVLAAEQAAIVMLEGGVKGDVVANVECSGVLEDYVRSYGGRVHWVPVGHTFMIRGVIESGAVMGVERSSHYAVPLNPFVGGGIIAAIYLVESLCKIGRKISEVVPRVRPLKRRRIPVDDAVKFQVAEMAERMILERYERVVTIDGVRVDLEDGWFLVRPSNTEPVIRVTSEGVTEERAEELAELAEKIVLRALEEFRRRGSKS